MISIQQTLSELEKTHQMRTMAMDCYLAAINSMSQYTVELDPGITAPQKRYLTALATEVAEGSAPELAESRSTLRGLLRDYRDRAAQYLGALREQLSSTAQALQQMVEALMESDSDHTSTVQLALARLRSTANSPAGAPVRGVLMAATDSIEESLEQIRKQHQLTVTQFHAEMRILHNRIDSLEAAAALDDATKFSNRRFLTEYLTNLKGVDASFVVLRVQGLGGARGKHGTSVAEDVVATLGRRLRNTIPKNLLVGRWSDQDFLIMLPDGQAADLVLCRRIAEHLSMPYACLIGGKVVRIPLEITAECLSVAAGTANEEILSRVTEAFA